MEGNTIFPKLLVHRPSYHVCLDDAVSFRLFADDPFRPRHRNGITARLIEPMP